MTQPDSFLSAALFGIPFNVRLTFSQREARSFEAIIVSFDLSGFSTFCNRPDAPAQVPRFMALVFDETNRFLQGFFDRFWNGSNVEKMNDPNFIKFTGDGAIMIWLAEDGGPFSDNFCTAVVKTMRQLQLNIYAAVPKWEKEWKINGLPRNTRYGIAKGRVYALNQPDQSTACDYVGYPINLAVRLQNHCPEVGFLVHADLHPEVDGMERLIAVNMKGAQMEPVLAFREDLVKVTSEQRFEKKFRR